MIPAARRGGAVVVLGIFAADAAFRADRLPELGETLIGRGFALGPGGKGSNQAVAAARAGARTHLVTRLGRDPFADMAGALWAEAGVTAHAARSDAPTGAAFIFVREGDGANAIIVAPGAGAGISADDVAAQAGLIGGAAVFLTQLEQPQEDAMAGLRLARAAGAATILNPAPAAPLPDAMLALCDVITPNETEAAALTGIPVRSAAEAAEAARILIARGAGAAAITLGARGALYRDDAVCVHVPAFRAGEAVDATGAGDAFNGAFAAALARGADPVSAVRFGCAGAGISVTRRGAAASSPTLAEIEALLARAP